MNKLLVSLLVVAILGFVFAEPDVEKRSFKSFWRKVKNVGKKAIDAYKGSKLQQGLKDVGNTVLDIGKNIALKGLDKAQDVLVKKATGGSGF